MWHRRFIVFVALALLVAACGLRTGSSSSIQQDSGLGSQPSPTPTLGPLPAEVLPLPFADNPDPTACGIPVPWTSDDDAWITGYYEGKLVQPVVFLYDSHLRREVVGQVPHGSQIEITLSQTNPVLNYYHVHWGGTTPAQEGWVPAPFVSFEPVD